MNSLSVVVEKEIQVKATADRAPMKLLICDLKEGNVHRSLIVAGVKMMFSKNSNLSSKHTVRSTPLPIWKTISYLAS